MTPGFVIDPLRKRRVCIGFRCFHLKTPLRSGKLRGREVMHITYDRASAYQLINPRAMHVPMF
jgi:hypothetical protein